MSLKATLMDAMKNAMRANEKSRLEVIRLIQACVMQVEVDQGKRESGLTDAEVLAIMDKMIKQRRDSIEQFNAGNRPELAEKEAAEILIIQDFLPQALSDTEIQALIDEALASVTEKNMAAMGKAMAILKPQIQGRADASKVSALVKVALGL